MSKTNFVIIRKIQVICTFIKNHFNVSYSEARKMLYNSKLYNMEKKINDFVVFCLETFKLKYNLSGKEVYNLFDKYKVFNYLKEGYDMLHTQGEAWLVNDIKEFLKIRDYDIENIK